jgi:rhodanese-related sulfurtransferase
MDSLAQERRRSKCLALASNNQAQFPNPLSSCEFIQLRQQQDVIVVDVRSDAERRVSTLPDAMSLRDFEKMVPHVEDRPVVIYCTIGYRSGLEVRRFQRQYGLERVYNLDGIVAYVLAMQELNQESESRAAAACLVDPQTGEGTTRLHTFGRMWDFVDPAHFQTVYFQGWNLQVRLLQVGRRATLRTLQHGVHFTLSCCSCCARTKHH